MLMEPLMDELLSNAPRTKTLPQAEMLYLTHVDTLVERADAHFPAFDPAQWEVVARQAHAADAKHALAFEFVDYRRRRSAP